MVRIHIQIPESQVKIQCHDNRVDFTQFINEHFVEQVHQINLRKPKRIVFERNNQ